MQAIVGVNSMSATLEKHPTSVSRGPFTSATRLVALILCRRRPVPTVSETIVRYGLLREEIQRRPHTYMREHLVHH